MAYESTRAYYDKQANLAKENADIAYNMALADLGRRFGIANRRLETNLESRGILRSGEANTARTEMTAEEEAAKTAAEMTKLGAYNQADMTLAGQLAALQAGSGSSGSTPSPTDNAPQYDFSKVDFAGLGKLMNANKVKATGAKITPTFSTTGLYGMTRPVRGIGWSGKR
jgi:hypothetical protein